MKFLRNDPLSRLLGTNVGLGSSIEIFAASGPHFPRERTLQQTDHRTAMAGWPMASLARWFIHRIFLFVPAHVVARYIESFRDSRHAPRRRASASAMDRSRPRLQIGTSGRICLIAQSPVDRSERWKKLLRARSPRARRRQSCRAACATVLHAPARRWADKPPRGKGVSRGAWEQT